MESMENIILLVEDTKSWYETLDFILKDEGYKVLWAERRKEAEDILSSVEYKIDAVIVNLNLSLISSIPDGTGYRILDYLKNNRPSLPIIVLAQIDKPSKIVELYERYKVNHVEIKEEFSGQIFIKALHDAIATTEPIKTQNYESDTAIDDFDVFLCHNSEDKSEVKKIANFLKMQNVSPWLDEWELRPGISWQQALGKQIKKIKSAAVFVGNKGVGPWQQRELEAFLLEFVERDCSVIPVMLPNAPKKPKLPVFLKGIMWVDFRKNDPNPLEQLIWGITGKQHRSC